MLINKLFFLQVASTGCGYPWFASQIHIHVTDLIFLLLGNFDKILLSV